MEKSHFKLHFTYDPIGLTRLVLDIYTENHIIKKNMAKSYRFALYDTLSNQTDKDIELLLDEMAKKEGISTITYKDYTFECKSMMDILQSRESFKDFVLHYQSRGVDGLGVIDHSRKAFHPCGFARHWPTVQKILEDKYPLHYEAFTDMYFSSRCNKAWGITRKELDDFILSNFYLVSSQSDLSSYL